RSAEHWDNTTFEQAVMVAIVRLGAEGYGRRILNDVQERLERDVAAGAVYTTLDRLEAKGLLSSTLAPGTALRGGRAAPCPARVSSSTNPWPRADRASCTPHPPRHRARVVPARRSEFDDHIPQHPTARWRPSRLARTSYCPSARPS